MFAVLPAVANFDWNVAAAAAATFVVTGVATAFGFRKGYKKIEADRAPQAVPIVGASLMDNMSILLLTEALRENTDLHRQIQTCLTEIKVLLQLGINKRD
jgi:uncharacterized membrane protein